MASHYNYTSMLSGCLKAAWETRGLSWKAEAKSIACGRFSLEERSELLTRLHGCGRWGSCEWYFTH